MALFDLTQQDLDALRIMEACKGKIAQVDEKYWLAIIESLRKHFAKEE